MVAGESTATASSPASGGRERQVGMSGESAAPTAAKRAASGAGRLVRVWRTLPHDRRLAAYASIGLFLALFLPWYQETVIASGTATHLQSASASITGWGAFSFVEAAVLLVAAGVLTLLFQRAEGRAFHLPGGDGWVIMAAGFWTCVLIVWRIFDKTSTSVRGPGATTSGIEWGIFVALAVAIFLTYAGSRIRAAHQLEPPLPGEEGGSPPSQLRAERRSAGAGGSCRPARQVRPPRPVAADRPPQAAPSDRPPRRKRLALGGPAGVGGPHRDARRRVRTAAEAPDCADDADRPPADTEKAPRTHRARTRAVDLGRFPTPRPRTRCQTTSPTRPLPEPSTQAGRNRSDGDPAEQLTIPSRALEPDRRLAARRLQHEREVRARSARSPGSP